MIQSLWNPFRDWNIAIAQEKGYKFFRFKASETLLGIETQSELQIHQERLRFKASETLLGIETVTEWKELKGLWRFKASETLLGIETALTVMHSK